jgi:hypothetical protein
VFAVWEPILPTDWSAPNSGALQHLKDGRVRQFWDPNHLVAGVLKKAEEAGRLHPSCCTMQGNLWDLTAAYAPGTYWRETMPPPVVFDGPVVRSSSDLDSVIQAAEAKRTQK